MLKIGLTGGIGSGKSTVAKVFELLGVPVYYADHASKRLYDTNRELAGSIREHFGPDLFREGVLDRAALAQRVFTDPQKLALLNALVHPLTIRDAEEWMAQQQAPYIIKEAALIFESGSGAALDAVIGVHAAETIRIRRVVQRDGIGEERVRDRMRHQIDEEIKMKLCDYVIQNDEHTLLIPQVLRLHELLTARSTEKTGGSLQR